MSFAASMVRLIILFRPWLFTKLLSGILIGRARPSLFILLLWADYVFKSLFTGEKVIRGGEAFWLDSNLHHSLFFNNGRFSALHVTHCVSKLKLFTLLFENQVMRGIACLAVVTLLFDRGATRLAMMALHQLCQLFESLLKSRLRVSASQCLWQWLRDCLGYSLLWRFLR